MKILDDIKVRFAALRQKLQEKTRKDGKRSTFFYICKWIYKLRSVFMAIPVAFAAIILAIYNASHLPEKVSVYVPSFAEQEMIVKATELSRGSAIWIPLLITAGCLLLMFCSRKTVFPWVISIFTLVLPYLIYLTNLYALS